MGTYGPVSKSTLTAVDLVAPGLAPISSAVQFDNKIIKVTAAIPVMDANGDNLSGLSKLTVAVALMIGGVDPFLNKTMTEILALPGVKKIDVAITTEDAGKEKTVDVPLQGFGVHSIVAACSD